MGNVGFKHCKKTIDRTINMCGNDAKIMAPTQTKQTMKNKDPQPSDMDAEGSQRRSYTRKDGRIPTRCNVNDDGVTG